MVPPPPGYQHTLAGRAMSSSWRMIPVEDLSVVNTDCVFLQYSQNKKFPKQLRPPLEAAQSRGEAVNITFEISSSFDFGVVRCLHSFVCFCDRSFVRCIRVRVRFLCFGSFDRFLCSIVSFVRS